MMKRAILACLVGVLLLALAAPGMADQVQMVGLIRGHAAFGLQICRDGGAPTAQVVRRGARVCGPVNIRRVPGQLAFTFDCGAATFVVARNGSFKIFVEGRCITGQLVPVE